MATKKLPTLYFGTMTFGWSQASSFVNKSTAAAMVKAFADAQGALCRIDTARIYSGGDSEKILGEALRDEKNATLNALVDIGTKAHPSQPGGLSPDGIRRQLDASLEAMGVSQVKEFYLHQPDPEADLEASLRCTDALAKEGLIGAVGMSNYHASEVARAFALCNEHGLTKPSVCQGLYNPLNRLAEDELIPVLRANQCSFVAYNPLAAGLLTGAHTAEPGGDIAAGRFKNNPNYMPRFYTPANFAALGAIRAACDAAGVTLVEATYRWMLSRSALDGNDGLLLGASSLAQLESNLAGCLAARGDEPLPEAVVAAFEGAWSGADAHELREGAFPYWRSYSKDMPGRDKLPPGASMLLRATTRQKVKTCLEGLRVVRSCGTGGTGVLPACGTGVLPG